MSLLADGGLPSFFVPAYYLCYWRATFQIPVRFDAGLTFLPSISDGPFALSEFYRHSSFALFRAPLLLDFPLWKVLFF